VSTAAWVVNTTIRRLTRVACRVDDAELAKVPLCGPLILVVNHINFLEVPVTYTHLLPRRLTGFAKAETWNNPALGWLFNMWEAIPVRRGEVDTRALRRGVEVLQQGQFLAVAPEGTRSGTGRLQTGRPGVVMVALWSKAPLLPIAYYGGELFSHNVRRLRRTEFHFAVGRPFRLDDHGERVTHRVRQQMADEIMYQLAAILPPAYRGVYSDFSRATETYLQFEPPATTNLTR
jgi:1-acyl-sn-glycerol-3-phosphate acyltransferase